ncbi:virion structural protein [Pseudomonas phage PhiPA3]|uniref:Virion structural protein n=1 Tax=Pseudomonas phage PhiPA3 TaxID=998086 RepID=F8SJY2_BPPA3|nr:virion structural protein [Pseudomonas phage PhiPA3]AEH03530.1 virion structural protein [Pseudomonas phage PhiPA3]
MSVDKTLLMREVNNVIQSGDGHYNFRMEIKILANKKWITPVRLDHYRLVRDYSSGQVGDDRTVEFLMNYGDFAYDILPYRDNLIVEYTEVPLREVNSARDWDKRSTTKRYRGILNMSGQSNPALSSKNSLLQSREALNQISMIPIQMQLVDELTYRVMMASYGNTFVNMTTKDMVIASHHEVFAALGGTDDQRLLGWDIADGWNPDVHYQIGLPDGIRLADIPRFLQNDEGGIYPTGMGRYIQNQIFYMYPLFDTTRFNKKTRVLNLINIPSDRYEGAEKTYKSTDRHVTVIATGNASSLDDGLATVLQQGNGVRFGNANNLLTDQAVTKDNKMLMDRASNLYEVNIGNLQTGFNNTRWANERVTANPYKQYSIMAQRQGQQLDLEWVNGNPDELYPGMPVKFFTISGDTVKIYHGTLLGVGEQRTASDASPVVNRHVSKCQLSVFVNRFEIVDDTISPTP